MKRLTILFAVLAICSIVPMYGYAIYDGASDINVTTDSEIEAAREAAIADIEAEMGGSTDTNIVEVANTAKEEIRKNSNVTQIKEIKDLAIYKIQTIKDINDKIGERTPQLFYNVVIEDKMKLLKHAQKLNDAETIRIEIMGRLELAVWVYDSAKAEDQTALPTDPQGTKGTAVVITKGEKSVTLINPDMVEYIKITE